MIARRMVLVAGIVLAVAAGGAVALSPFPLIGTVWAWHATTRDDAVRATIESPERYTIELLPDGAVRVRADCNRGGGRYEAADVDLRFGPIATTKKGCPAGSRDREFLEALSRIDRYRFEGIELVLASADGRRTLRFKPLGADLPR
jgi:heat shock protein HslJ